MKMTLLEMVQDILNDMDSDEVNGIDDTIEAQQVAQIIKTCYFEMIGNRNWPHLRKLVQFEAALDLSKPNYLRLPERLKELVFLKYDVTKEGIADKDFKELKFKEPDDFLRYVSSRRSSATNVTTVVDFSGVSLLVVNDTAPSYWTTFDDTYAVMDSYDSAVDDTLMKSKTQALAYIIPTWERTNESIPDLPIEAFPALLEEAKSTCFTSIKQMVNQKAEQKAGRQNRWLSRKAWSLEGGVKYEDYGRRSRRG